MSTEKTNETVQEEKELLDDVLDNTQPFTIGIADDDSITVSREYIRDYVAIPTKSGKLPSEKDIEMFGRHCESYGLDPRKKEAYLVGYDSQGKASFSIITSFHVLLKRLERHPLYRGKECGVLVWDKQDKKVVELEGDVFPTTYDLVGAWCRIHMDGRKPEYATASLKAYDKGFGYWKTDPAWMVTKCAISKAIRNACPNDTGGMVTHEEVSTPILDRAIERTDHVANAKKAAERKAASKKTTKKSEPADTCEWTEKLGRAKAMFAKADDEEAIKGCLEIFPDEEIAADIGMMAEDARKRLRNQ